MDTITKLAARRPVIVVVLLGICVPVVFSALVHNLTVYVEIALTGQSGMGLITWVNDVPRLIGATLGGLVVGWLVGAGRPSAHAMIGFAGYRLGFFALVAVILGQAPDVLFIGPLVTSLVGVVAEVILVCAGIKVGAKYARTQ